MKLLLVGGSGFVGTMTMPYLKEEHTIRVLDVVPPQEGSVEYVNGSALDAAAVGQALDGMDAAVYMALRRESNGRYSLGGICPNYDLNVKGLHYVLHGMVEASVRRMVYVSTLSVHGGPPGGVYDTEDLPLDAATVYGFTKGLGERVCEYFARVHGLSVVALRLNMPVTREEWHRQCQPGQPNPATAAPDVASAISLAAAASLSAFHAVFISGDYEGKVVNCSRAKELLGWECRERPAAATDAAESEHGVVTVTRKSAVEKH
jgi:nucleoside-diphosphate-sugar epimerase